MAGDVRFYYDAPKPDAPPATEEAEKKEETKKTEEEKKAEPKPEEKKTEPEPKEKSSYKTLQPENECVCTEEVCMDNGAKVFCYCPSTEQ